MRLGSQILHRCLTHSDAQRSAGDLRHHQDESLDIPEIVSTVRKGRDQDGGAGKVLTRWTDAAPSGELSSFKVCDTCESSNLAVIVVNS